jgi:hypothetical protein
MIGLEALVMEQNLRHQLLAGAYEFNHARRALS